MEGRLPSPAERGSQAAKGHQKMQAAEELHQKIQAVAKAHQKIQAVAEARQKILAVAAAWEGQAVYPTAALRWLGAAERPKAGSLLPGSVEATPADGAGLRPNPADCMRQDNL